MRTTLLLLITLFATEVISQGLNYGVKLGHNCAKMLIKDDDGKISSEYKVKGGIHFGGFVEYPVSELLTLEGELLFETKGIKYKEKNGSYSETETYNTWYIDIPVRVKHSREVATDVTVFGGLGMYFGLGLGGKYKSVTKINGEKDKFTEKINWGNDPDDDDLKRFDAGLSFAAGCEYKFIIVTLSYDLGLANISPYTEDGARIKNRVFRISVGYRITGDEMDMIRG